MMGNVQQKDAADQSLVASEGAKSKISEDMIDETSQSFPRQEQQEKPGSADAAADDVVPTMGKNHCDTAHHRLSTVQKQAVDQAFERLFGYPWGTCFELPPVLNHEQRMLVRIFGPEMAASLSQHSVRTSRGHGLISLEPRHHAIRASRLAKTAQNPTKESTKLPPIASKTQGSATTAAPLPPHQPPRPPEIAAPARNGGGVGGGVDRLLSEISGKQSTTTIAKTSTDWETFKSSSGLATTIEEKAQSKDSYLNRQDFLTRVDHRRFEVEKQERDKERAKRGT